MDSDKVNKNIFNHEWNKWGEHNFDYYNAKLGVLDNKNCPVIFFDILSLLAKDCDYKIKECYVDSRRLIISGRSKGSKNELMLRFAGENEELVVARVCFINQRTGNMTELYEILKRIQMMYKAGRIVIESVMTDEMAHWCVKHGFVRDNTCNNYSEG